MSVLEGAIQTLQRIQPRQIAGRISTVRGLTVFAHDLRLPVGSLVRIQPSIPSVQAALGEVVGCDRNGTVIMLFSATTGLSPGDRVIGLQTAQTVPLGPGMLGRVLNGLGQPMDGGPALTDTVGCPLLPDPIAALERDPINEALPTGVRSVDAMVTAGKGQRVGIFSGPGVGKSTLLGSIARNTEADISVIALVGERGREVRDFIENALGPEGLARSVVIVATSDESPLIRIRAAMVACAAAEFWRDRGRDVVLMMDSITRFCQAQRQIGLATGEPPATKGYTPSVFAVLPTLLERAGNLRNAGSITGFYTVLVEGDDLAEPISDAARGVLDGHIVLTRKLANRGHYPAVDVLDSVSRVAGDVATNQQSQARILMASMLARYAEVEELVNIGAYVQGSNVEYDVAIQFKPRIDELLCQTPTDSCRFEETVNALVRLATEIGHALANHESAKKN